MLAGCRALDPAGDTLSGELEPGLPEAATPPVDSAWACLDRPAPARAVARAAGVRLTLAVADVGRAAPPEGVTARACNLLDVDCDTPITGDIGSSGDGRIHLMLPQGFDGFLEIRSPGGVPALFFLGRVLGADAVEELRVVDRAGLEALAATGGVQLDPAAGHLLIRAFDCEGAPAASVEVSSESPGQPFSFRFGLPVLGSSVTTGDGLAGFVNAPPGLAVLGGREVDGGRITGEASVLVRAGWLTFVDIEPQAD